MKKHLFFIIILIIISLATAGLPYFFSGFLPVWKDSIAVACAVKHIEQNHELGSGNHFYITYDNPNVPYCWDENVYPLNQIYQFSVKTSSGLNPALTVSLVYLFIYLLTVLVIYLLAFELYQKPSFAFFSGFLAASSPALLRIFTISPHQLFGFLVICAIAWFVLKYHKTGQKKFIFLILLSLLNLIWLHQLSLVVISVALFVYVITKIKKKWLIIPLLITFISLVLVTFVFLDEKSNPLRAFLAFFYNAVTEGMINLLSAHPIWDHPAILGYGLSILGSFGMFYSLFIKKFPLKIFWWTIIIVGLFMAHSYIFGFYLIGYRFLLFLFIPLSLLSPLFFIYLKSLFPRLSKYIVTITFFFVILASVFHSINFLLDNFNGLSKTVLPPQELKVAIEWLNTNSKPKDTILTTSRRDQKYASYLPYLYHGNVMVYPVFAFSNFTEFEFRDKTLEYLYSDRPRVPQSKLEKFIEPFYLKMQGDQEDDSQSVKKDRENLFDMYQMLNYPGKRSVKKIMIKYQIKYILAWQDEKEDKIFAAKKGGFDKIYENDLLVIYKRKKFI